MRSTPSSLGEVGDRARRSGATPCPARGRRAAGRRGRAATRPRWIAGDGPDEAVVDAVAQLEHRPAGPVVDVHVVVERRPAARRCTPAPGRPSPRLRRRWRRSSRSASRRAPGRPARRRRPRSGGQASLDPKPLQRARRPRRRGALDLGGERRQLARVARAERAAEVAGVHALQDAGQLPVAEGDVEVELPTRSRPGHLGVALDDLLAGPRSPARSSTGHPSALASSPGPVQYTCSRPTSASGSPSVQISQSSTATTSPSSTTMRVVEPVVAVDDRRRALLGDARGQRVVDLVDERQLARSAAASTGRTSA